MYHRDFQGPGWRQVPTPTSSHRQPDHSVLGEEWVWCVPVFSCVASQNIGVYKMFLHVQWISKDDSARKTLWCASSASVWEAEPRQCWLPASTSSSIPPSLWLVHCLTKGLCNHQPVFIYILRKNIKVTIRIIYQFRRTLWSWTGQGNILTAHCAGLVEGKGLGRYKMTLFHILSSGRYA